MSHKQSMKFKNCNITETYEEDEIDSDPNDPENIRKIRDEELFAWELFEKLQEIKQYEKNMIEQYQHQAMPGIAWLFNALLYYVLFAIYAVVYRLLI